MVPGIAANKWLGEPSRLKEAVDFRQITNISTFIDRTQIRDWEPYPKRIVLGSEDGKVYRLRSQLLDPEPFSGLPPNSTSGDSITKIQACNPITKRSLRFVFPLGTLDYTNDADFSRVETPFYVCINPVDRSIRLFLSPYTLDA